MLWTAPPTGTWVPWMWVLLRPPRFGGAKHASGYDNRSRHCEVGLTGSRRRCGRQVVVRRQLKRRYVLSFFEKLQPCLVGIEACASSHHWSRELRALGHANAARTDRPPRLAWARRAAFVGKRTTPEIHSCRMNACCRVRVTCTGRRANPERGRFFLELRERTHELRKQVRQTGVPKSD
jgi:transposase